MFKKRGIMVSFFKGFTYAFRGICFVISSERNMKVHLAISSMVILTAWFFELSWIEWIICLLCMALVLSAEIINTALENLVDLASPDFHSLAGNAKDAAAGAVLVAAIFSVIIGCIIFVPKIIDYFGVCFCD